MRQWEYQSIKRGIISHKELNELGEQGWELIYVSPIDNRGFELLFKREIEHSNDVTIEQVLNDIDAGRYKVSGRVRYILREDMQWGDKVYLSQVSFKRRNFGKKSQTELRELIEHYNTSVR